MYQAVVLRVCVCAAVLTVVHVALFLAWSSLPLSSLATWVGLGPLPPAQGVDEPNFILLCALYTLIQLGAAGTRLLYLKVAEHRFGSLLTLCRKVCVYVYMCV